MCGTKKRFRDDIAAKFAMTRMDTTATETRPIRAYKCPICKGWHLTSKKLLRHPTKV